MRNTWEANLVKNLVPGDVGYRTTNQHMIGVFMPDIAEGTEVFVREISLCKAIKYCPVKNITKLINLIRLYMASTSQQMTLFDTKYLTFSVAKKVHRISGDPEDMANCLHA